MQVTAQNQGNGKRWFDTPLAQRLHEAERDALRPQLEQLYGYHLVQLGQWGEPLYAPEDCGARNCFTLAHTRRRPLSAIAQPERLPLANSSVDVMVLPHTLEYASHRHAVLRDVYRSLVDGGHVVITAYSPYGSWGARKLLRRDKSRFPWNSRLLSEARVLDWLELLGFQVCQRFSFLPVWPSPDSSLDSSKLVAAAATGYGIVARKQVVPISPIRPTWSLRPNWVAALGAGRVSTADMNKDT